MRLYSLDKEEDAVFAYSPRHKMVCLGHTSDVERKPTEHIYMLFVNAIAIADYNEIKSGHQLLLQ